MQFRQSITTVSIMFALFIGMVGQIEAGYFYFEPLTKTVKPGEEFDMLLKASTEGEGIITTDARIDYDPSAVSFIKLVDIPVEELFFPQMFNRLIGDSVYIASYIIPAKPPSKDGQPRVGEGKIALIRMKSKKIGTTTLKIRCTPGQTTDSNMTLKRNGKVTDVVDCTKVKNAVITIGTETAPTSTPAVTPSATPTATLTPTAQVTPATTSAPTQAPQATITPTPSVLPETGSIETMRMVIAIGVGLTVISYLIKVYVS